MSKQFQIIYINPHQPKRIVGEEHFAKSSAFYPVLQLEVGEKIERRYHSAGYKSVKRVR